VRTLQWKPGQRHQYDDFMSRNKNSKGRSHGH
jgi:hypothetical protein